jgi:hypothetical protein
VTLYFVILTALAALTILAIWSPKIVLPGAIGVSIFLALFAGLRFETGFDWPVYTAIFNGIRTIDEALCGAPIEGISFAIEPLYLALNAIIKDLGGNLPTLFLLVAAINISVITFVASRIARESLILVWLVYFGFTFLPAQMAMERQSLASAFVLLALLMTVYRRHLSASLLLSVAIGFQYSAALYAPLLVLGFFRPNMYVAAAVVIAGGVINLFGLNLFTPVATLLQYVGSDGLSAKLNYYIQFGVVPLSIATIGSGFIQVAVLAGLYWLPTKAEQRDPFVIMALWLTIWILGGLLYFSGMPSIWNRITLVALPWQVATLCRLIFWQELTRGRKTALASLASLTSAAVLFFYITKPSTAVYRPYNSVVQVALTNLRGDGESRSKAMIEQFESEHAVQGAKSAPQNWCR